MYYRTWLQQSKSKGFYELGGLLSKSSPCWGKMFSLSRVQFRNPRYLPLDPGGRVGERTQGWGMGARSERALQILFPGISAF